MTIVVSLVIGFILDCLFGDPHWLPHPVRLIGFLISSGEKLLRKTSCKTSRSRFVCGMILSIGLVCVSFVVPFFLLLLLERVSIWLRIAVESVMCYQILAMRSLKAESMKVYHALTKNDLSEAREKLSWIVGRETQNLDEQHVTRAAVETVAENTSDGVTAPLFYLLIGGAPLGFLYKAVNTLDSMIGYKNEKYMDFGKFAARLDDVVNFIPARLTAGLMILASLPAGLDLKNAARIYKRDRKNHHSPNSACTESVCAGALRVQLGGDSRYFGKLVHKPTIGDDLRPIEAEDIRRANRLMILTSVLFLLLGEAVRILVVRGWML